MRFWSDSLDDQHVVAICLHVQVTLARELDHLDRDVVLHPMVQHHPPIECADLRALVADDRPLQAEPPHPRERAGKWPAGARDHIHAGRHHPVDRLDVAGIQVQVHREDRAVEVQREQLVPDCYCYRLTSGFTRFGGRPPRTAVAMLRAAIADISERVRTVALAIWGARTTLGIGTSPGWTAG